MKLICEKLSVLLIVVLLLIFVDCKKNNADKITLDSISGSDTRGKSVLRAAHLTTANYLTLLAKDNILQKNLEVENARIEFVGPSAPVDALKIVITGNADVTTTGTGYFINLIEQGGEWVAFALEKYSGDSQGIVAAPASGINRVEDLYEKKIGIAQLGATADYIVNTVFAYKGLDVSKIEKISLAQADFMTAFTSGKIDALASFDQNFANALSVPGSKKLIDGIEYKSLNWTIHIAARSFAVQHKTLLKAAYNVLREKSAQAGKNPLIIADSYKELGASDKVVEIIKTFSVPEILPMNKQAVDDLKKQAEQYLEYGFIKSMPDDFSRYVIDFSE